MDRSTYASGGDGSDNGLSSTVITNGGGRQDQRNIYANGRALARVPGQHYVNGNGRHSYMLDALDSRYNGARYNEPENNKSAFLPVVGSFDDVPRSFSEHGREDHRLRSQRSESRRRTLLGRREPVRRPRSWPIGHDRSCSTTNRRQTLA